MSQKEIRTMNIAPRWTALGAIAIDQVKKEMTSSSKKFVIGLIEDACLKLDKFNDEIKEQQ